MDFVVFVINFLFSALYLLLIIRALLPWVPNSKMNPLFGPVYFITEPLLGVIRLGLPPLRIGMDVSPFVVIILLWLVQRALLKFVFGG